jgi:cytochrome c-type biogenesis protein CcmF
MPDLSKLVMTGFGLALAFWLIGSVILEIMERTKFLKNPRAFFRRAARQPRASWGMSCAHLGLGVMLLGMVASEAFMDEELKLMQVGETVPVGAYSFTLDRVEPVAGPNYTAVRATVTVMEGGRFITRLQPEDRVYSDPPMNTTEASIHPLFSGDLYAVIGEGAGEGRWSMRLYYKPLISGLWVGALLMVLGAILSLTDRRRRVGAPSGKRKSQANIGEAA